MARVIHGIDGLRALIGQEVGASDWITVSQDRIDQFAQVTGDHQWIHVDPDRARSGSPYGSTIAHGFLTLSLLSDLSRDAIDIQGDFKMRINYGINRLRFPNAVRAGSRVRGRFTLKSVEDIPGGVQVTWDSTVEVEGAAKPAVAADWLIRIYY